MEYPNFSNAEFINQNIWNKGITQLVGGVHAFSGNSAFFIPGVLNPNAVQTTFFGNLTVQFNLPAPFTVLFTNGYYTGAHGATTGQDTSVYLLDFTSFVPSTGNQVVYVGMSYAVIQQDPYTIVGPPIGHPDYSPQFQPYVAYATEQETIILTVTATPPDNLSVVELGRVLLSAGQISIGSIDFSHQKLASLNIPPVTLAGDVTGLSTSNLISRLQGKTVSAASPPTNSYLYFNGTAWVPASATLILAGDVTGPFSNNTVTAIRRIPVTTTAPTNGQNLQFVASNNDLEWVTPPPIPPSIHPGDAAAFDVTGTFPNLLEVVGVQARPITNNPTAVGQALTLAAGNVLNWVAPITGSINNGFVKIPVGNQVFVLQWGLFDTGAPFHNNDKIVIPWNIPFHSVCFGATTCVHNHPSTVNLITAGILDYASSPSLTINNGQFLILAEPAGGNIIGVYWLAWGDGTLP